MLAPSMHDFHLLAGTAAVDTGLATPATADFDGNARPQGAAFDIGAYERVHRRTAYVTATSSSSELFGRRRPSVLPAK